jgi:hypothetical protein
MISFSLSLSIPMKNRLLSFHLIIMEKTNNNKDVRLKKKPRRKYD